MIWASASCPVGRSVIWRVRSNGLVGSKRVDQRVLAVELMVLVDVEDEVWKEKS